TCPLHDSVLSPEAQAYLWRRCCICHHLNRLYDGNIPKTGQNFYHESMLRDAGGMTTLTPPISRLHRGGILYGQISTALGISPQLRNGAQSICGKPASGKTAIDRAYLASKRRCHYGLTDSKQRCA
ncbi:hypothetical protein CEP52_017343, partial [Fusarium oligoseptatum]